MTDTSPLSLRAQIQARLGRLSAGLGVAMIGLTVFATAMPAQSGNALFRRIATYPVYLNACNGQPDDCINETTVAEITAASEDGETLIYTDSPGERIGFLDISDPANPQPGGVIDMGGEPTSVGVSRGYALVAVNTSPSFAAPSGQLQIIEIATKKVVRTIELGGQPDAVAISRNRRYAAIAIENERDEELCVGGTLNGQAVDEDECDEAGGRLGTLPQLPAGFLVIVDTVGNPASWGVRNVSLTGIADKFPQDPEPEFVDINAYNVAVVTLQENNHIVLVDLATGKIRNDFRAGAVNLTGVDNNEDGVIDLSDNINGVLREPDAVAWISPVEFATADEGDLDGGSRGFTIFNDNGSVRFAPGNAIEQLAARIGHASEDRSENKGTEPEGVEFGLYGSRRLLFVGSERSSFVAVYQIPASGTPELLQVLPATTGPEGLLAIPQRNLFVASSEEDSREDTLRASITIYRLEDAPATYPTIVSANRADGNPISWGALSGLSASPTNADIAYSVYDNYYDKSRIFTIDVSKTPAVITAETPLIDGKGNTFHFDLEGIAARRNGGFWLASEGGGSCSEAGVCDAVTSKNLLIEATAAGRVVRQIELPQEVNELQFSNGYEGVAVTGSGENEVVYVAFQREWVNDPAGMVRIGKYQVAAGEWTFFYYPLDAVESPNGGWVGLSEIVAVNDNTLAILERDNQANTDAKIKKIYMISLSGIEPVPQGEEFPVATKTLVRDIIPDLTADHGLVIEKVEGLGILSNGEAIIVTDNDGTDGSSGETQFLNLGRVF